MADLKALDDHFRREDEYDKRKRLISLISCMICHAVNLHLSQSIKLIAFNRCLEQWPFGVTFKCMCVLI